MDGPMPTKGKGTTPHSTSNEIRSLGLCVCNAMPEATSKSSKIGKKT